MAEFRPVTRQDLDTILGIYNQYVLNSTATFHSVPLTV